MFNAPFIAKMGILLKPNCKEFGIFPNPVKLLSSSYFLVVMVEGLTAAL
jgi:hypothetical protein